MRDAEASASSDASASSYRCSEDIGILAIVVAKLKLIQIQGQIFLAHVVIGADHATLLGGAGGIRHRVGSSLEIEVLRRNVHSPHASVHAGISLISPKNVEDLRQLG